MYNLPFKELQELRSARAKRLVDEQERLKHNKDAAASAAFQKMVMQK